MRKELKGFVAGVLLTSTIVVCVPVFAGSVVKSIKVAVNSITVKVNGEKVKADNFVYEGRTYVQLRNICDLLGKDLTWDKDTNTAGINDKKVENTQQGTNTETKQPQPTVSPEKSQSTDSTKPTVTSVSAVNGTSVEVLFSEKVDKASAENTSNYSIALRYGSKSALPISIATLDSTGTKVTLITSGQAAATLYNIDTANVSDTSGNIMDKDSKTFVGMNGGGTDTTPPSNSEKLTAQSITVLSLDTFEVAFSQKLDKSTAENPSNYLLTEKYGAKEKVQVVKAVLDSTGTKVVLTTSTLERGLLLTISFSGIRDIYGGTADETQSLIFASTPAQ